MGNYIVLDKRKKIKKIKRLFDELKVYKTFKNNRTEIWENDDLQISIDKSIIRILIYSQEDIKEYINILTEGKVL